VTEPGVAAEAGLRERKKQATRLALRRAALELAVEHGPDHVTVEDIAAAADVSPRTFFNYFASKEEALVGEHTERLATIRTLVAARPADETPVVAVGAALTEYVASLELDRGMWALRRRLAERHPEVLPRIHGANARAEGEIALAVAERTGLPAAHPYCELLAAVTVTAVRVALMRAACDKDLEPATAVAEAFAALAAGLPAPTA
jgi:AcrR family transcriptional regulator